MFKNVKIIVLYQNIGGHELSYKSFVLKKGVGGGVGEGFSGGTLKKDILCCFSPIT
jgi:hypothetical protein